MNYPIYGKMIKRAVKLDKTNIWGGSRNASLPENYDFITSTEAAEGLNNWCCCCMWIQPKILVMLEGAYSPVSNKRVGANKYAGWKNP